MGSISARKYAYSSTRVKGIESKLLTKEMINQLISTKDPAKMTVMLLDTDYRDYIERFGGIKSMDKLIDFALSTNLGDRLLSLIRFTPNENKEAISSIVGLWDISNIKIIIGAIKKNSKYEDISRYLVNSPKIDAEIAKEAISKGTIEKALEFLELKTNYSYIKDVIEIYKKNGKTSDIDNAIDQGYYKSLLKVASKLSTTNNRISILISRQIDVRNILILLKAKKYNINFNQISNTLVDCKELSIKEMERIFTESSNLKELTEKIKVFDLSEANLKYEKNSAKYMMIFEISMMNQLYNLALSKIRSSVLSFSAIVAYFYLKQIEVLNLRILIKGRINKLTEEELREMMIWKA